MERCLLFDENDRTPIAEDGRKSSIDNHTIYDTPAPVAASTVMRDERRGERILRGTDILGSFLEASGSLTTPPEIDDIGHIKMTSFSLNDSQSVNRLSTDSRDLMRPVTEGAGPGMQGTSGGDVSLGSSQRSSLGILPVDKMTDLSSSQLGFDISWNKPKNCENYLPGIGECNEQESASRSNLSGGDISTSHSGRKAQPDHVRNPKAVDNTATITRSKPYEPPSELGHGLMLDNTDADADASMHKVEFDESELGQFDDEFSDIGDLDCTVTDDVEGAAENASLDMFRQRIDMLTSSDALDKFFNKSEKVMSVSNSETQESTLPDILSRIDAFKIVGPGGEPDDQQQGGVMRYAPSGMAAKEKHEIDSEIEIPQQEQQERTCPVGGDITGEQQNIEPWAQRHVRFKSPAQTPVDPAIVYSGLAASSGSHDSLDERNIFGEDSRLASQFLMPSAAMGSSQANESSQVYGLDQSSFNLADLCVPAVRDISKDNGTPGEYDNENRDGAQSADSLFPEDEGVGSISDFAVTGKESFAAIEYAHLQPSGSPFSDRSGDGRFSSDSRANENNRDMFQPEVLRNSSEHVDNFTFTNKQDIMDEFEREAAHIQNGSDIFNSKQSTMEEFDRKTAQVHMGNTNDLFSNKQGVMDEFEKEVQFSIQNGGDMAINKLNIMDEFEREAAQFHLPSGDDGGTDVFTLSNCKRFLAENSPVYLNEKGQGVTDLAYQTDLGQVAVDPFDGMDMADLQGEFEENNFVSADKGLEMFNQAEEEFERENKFVQNEQMDLDNSVSLSESWMMNSSNVFLSNSQVEEEQAYMRISIGTFIGQRTGALGSLEGRAGREGTVRPTFGNKIITPPSNRKPVALLEASDEAGDVSKCDFQLEVDQPDPTDSTQSKVRGTGVGSDVDVEAADTTLIVDDLSRADDFGEFADSSSTTDVQRLSQPSQNGVGRDSMLGGIPLDTDILAGNMDMEHRSCSQTSMISASSDSSAGSFKDDTSLSDKTGVLTISTITDIITAASTGAKAQDLAGMIMQMSQAKASTKQKNKTDSIDSAHSHLTQEGGGSQSQIGLPVTGRQSSNDQSTKQYMAGENSHFPAANRKPADGKCKKTDSSLRGSAVTGARDQNTSVPYMSTSRDSIPPSVNKQPPPRPSHPPSRPGSNASVLSQPHKNTNSSRVGLNRSSLNSVRGDSSLTSSNLNPPPHQSQQVGRPSKATDGRTAVSTGRKPPAGSGHGESQLPKQDRLSYKNKSTTNMSMNSASRPSDIVLNNTEHSQSRLSNGGQTIPAKSQTKKDAHPKATNHVSKTSTDLPFKANSLPKAKVKNDTAPPNGNISELKNGSHLQTKSSSRQNSSLNNSSQSKRLSQPKSINTSQPRANSRAVEQRSSTNTLNSSKHDVKANAGTSARSTGIPRRSLGNQCNATGREGGSLKRTSISQQSKNTASGNSEKQPEKNSEVQTKAGNTSGKAIYNGHHHVENTEIPDLCTPQNKEQLETVVNLDNSLAKSVENNESRSDSKMKLSGDVVWMSPRPSSVFTRSMRNVDKPADNKDNNKTGQLLKNIEENDQQCGDGKRSQDEIGRSVDDNMFTDSNRQEKDIHATPEDADTKATRHRMSSTPMFGTTENITISGSISHISPLNADGEEPNLWQPGTDKYTPDFPFRRLGCQANINQSTPKQTGKNINTGYFESRKPQNVTGEQNEKKSNQPLESQNIPEYEHVTLPHSPVSHLPPRPRGQPRGLTVPSTANINHTETGHSVTLSPSSRLSEYPLEVPHTGQHTLQAAAPGYHAIPEEVTFCTPGKGMSHHMASTAPMSSIPSTDTGHHGYMTAPAQDLVNPIHVVSELRISEVCCVGLSVQTTLSVKNTSTRWQQVLISVASATLDGRELDTSRPVPFIMKEKIFMEPNSQEDVQIVFAPRQLGIYLAQLHLLSTTVCDRSAGQTHRLPAIVTLKAIAEVPAIQILSEGQKNVINFGSLPWGCQKGMSVTLLNKGRAKLPVRLRLLAEKTGWHCFTFDKSSADTSQGSIHSQPCPPSMTPSIVNMTLPGVSYNGDITPQQVTVYFKAPGKHFEKPASGPPEEFLARVEVEVDTPSCLMPLGCCVLSAFVGTARLHAPRDMELVNFRASVGQSHTQSIPLRNAGNIALEVSLEVTHWPDFFTVMPMQLMIEPGGQSDCLIKFSPNQTTAAAFESLLFMQVEPDGPSYEIQLCGQVSSPPPAAGYPQSKKQLLQSNKHLLAWGSVPLGTSRQQSISLKSDSDQMLKLRLQISSHTREFQFLSLYGDKEKTSSSKEIILRPKETFPLHVLFSPTRVANFVAKLYIRPTNNMQTKYTIPLVGYGGVSHLVMENLNMGQKDGYWVRMGSLSAGLPKITQVTLRNTGMRAAYVKIIPFQDLGLKKPLKDNKVSVKPDEFCLKENQSQTMTVVLNCTDRDAVLCQGSSSIVAVLAFIYGDEISRRLYRKSYLRLGKESFQPPDGSPVADVDFSLPYMDEDVVLEEADPTPNDAELFYTNMSHISLSLVGEPAPRSGILPLHEPSVQVKLHSMDAHTDTSQKFNKSPPDLKDSSPDRSPTPPVKDSSVPTAAPLNNLNTPSASQDDNQTWALYPKQLVLSAPSKEGECLVKHLQLINYTDQPLSYEASWPGHCVVISPEQGVLQPRSSAAVCVSSNSSLRTRKIQLPWQGVVHISCNKQIKVLTVQIREDMVLDDTVMANTDRSPRPLVPQAATPLIAVSTPGRNTQDHLKVMRQEITFPTNVIGTTTSQQLDITNIRPFPITWKISSLAPAYVKTSGTDGVYRVTYSAFWLSSQAGVLQPQQNTTIQVFFCAREVGSYTQGWDIYTEVAAASRQPEAYSCQLILNAQGTERSTSSQSGTTRQDLLGTMTASKLSSQLQAVTPQIQIGQQQHEVLTNDTSSTVTTMSTLGTLSTVGTMSGVSTVSNSTVPGKRRARSGHKGVVVKQDCLQFPATLPRHTHTCKLEINNRSDATAKVLISPIQAPFVCKHSRISVQAHHYIRLPVEFRPQKPGRWQGLLNLQPDKGPDINVTLIASC